jgi:hypothetical protein
MTPRHGSAPDQMEVGGTTAPLHARSVPATADTRQGSRRRFTLAQARRLVSGLAVPPVERTRVVCAASGPPVSGSARYCCASVGLDVLVARSQMDDPRCPCARSANWHPELVGGAR